MERICQPWSAFVERPMCNGVQDLKDWLTWLRHDVGYDGWRFDFAKGYRGERVREYVEATQPSIAVGEFWDACGYEGENGDQLCGNQVCLYFFRAGFCLKLCC